MQECNTGKHFRACDLYTLAGLKKNKKDQNQMKIRIEIVRVGG